MSYDFNSAVIQEISDHIYRESGIHFSDSNRVILESRLKERLSVLGDETPAGYLIRLQRDKDESTAFIDAITTNLTRFFRNSTHYKILIDDVLPDLIAHKGAKNTSHIRLWSAGCSTGEESYTNAMVLREHLPADWTLEVIASDLSLKSLIVAKEGFYPTSRVNGVPEHYLNKYFDIADGGYKIKEFVSKLVKFDYHNLKFAPGFKGCDIVFCRNVLIYFDETSQKNVISHLWEAMTEYSYLFIGHSESLFGMQTPFQFIRTDSGCLYAKRPS